MFPALLMFKKALRKKVCPQTKRGEKAGIRCPHLKGENQPLCLQQSSPLSDGLQKPPKIEFKAASPA